MGSTAFKVRSCHVLFSCRCLGCLVWMGWEWIYIKLLGKLSHFLWICRIASSSSVIIFCAPSTCHRISTDLDSEWISPQQSRGWGNVVLHLSKCWLRICSIWIAKGDPELAHPKEQGAISGSITWLQCERESARMQGSIQTEEKQQYITVPSTHTEY